MSKKILLPAVAALAVAALVPTWSQAQNASKGKAKQTDQAAAAAAFKTYCLGCHSAQVKSGGVVIDPDGIAQASQNAETWEKVIHQLRAETMPPPGVPRPAHALYGRMASALETKLDAASAAKPQVGDLPQLHRLTRTEYQNAIRDLLAIENLPQEMDYSVLLPADNSSSGFDNIADLLYISPAVMERYLDSARKISRLAVGDPKAPVMVNIHTVAVQHPQDAQVEELPMGTRGGIAIRSYFPLDATYEFKVDTAGQGRDAYLIEISVDGERKETIALGGPGGGPGRGRGAAPAKPAPAPPAATGVEPAVPPNAFPAGGGPGAAGFGGRGGAARPTYRIQVPAGSHLIGVTFAEKTEALDEAIVKPRTRSRGTQPSIGQVTISGPFDATGPGDTAARRLIFTCKPPAQATAAQESECAKKIIANFARKAYRRPVDAEDVTDLMPFYEAGRKESTFDNGIEKVIERILVSPQFLYRIEREKLNLPVGTAYPLSDLELASRISFFLWSSIPDDELLNIAASGKLRQPGVIEVQVKRMLADRRSESMVNNFASQWLFLRDLEKKDVDLFLFRDFDEVLRHDLQRETELFLDSILRENRPVTELISAKYSFLNERLAKHYEIPGIQGSYFRKVTFPPDVPRGGLLGQGSILTIRSYATRTSPVLRGKYVLENLLASGPPPPPPNVPSLKTETANSDVQLSMREAMTLHRASPACAGCHAKMDPIGFSLENFDAAGRWRDIDGSGKLIDASTQLADGTKFTGVEGLKAVILKNPERFVSAVSEKLLMYGIGRNVQYFDAPAVRAIVRDAAKKNYTFAALVEGVVKSKPFQMRATLPVRNQ
jgi:cytochrome c553